MRRYKAPAGSAKLFEIKTVTCRSTQNLGGACKSGFKFYFVMSDRPIFRKRKHRFTNQLGGFFFCFCSDYCSDLFSTAKSQTPINFHNFLQTLVMTYAYIKPHSQNDMRYIGYRPLTTAPSLRPIHCMQVVAMLLPMAL